MGIKIPSQVFKKVVLVFTSFVLGNLAAEPQSYFSVYNVNPKYSSDVKSFCYVNASAPKGGALKMSFIGTFDGLNPFTVVGSSPTHIRLFCFARLLGDSVEEVGVSYPYVAHSLEISADKKTITYFLNNNATFSDGTPITADDVVWSFNFITKVNPMMKHYYRDVGKVEALDAHTVKFCSKNPDNKELPGIIGQLEVLPSEFFKANMTENGGINKPFPASGPYKIALVDFGRTIVFERVKNWWGEGLPINVGLHNFDQITLQFYRERNAAFQAFLAGDLNLWIESSAKQWNTAYDLAAVKDGKIIKKVITDAKVTATTGFVFNLRREKFKDIRVRKAISLLFHFNSMNRSIFHNHYYRLNSYYGNDELAHRGVPQDKELSLLQKHQDQVPAEVFQEEFRNPFYKSDFLPREIVQQALDLLKEAGWELKNQTLTNKAGEEFEIIIPYRENGLEAIILHMQRNCQTVGIKVSPRFIDSSTFVEMIDQFDFDMAFMAIAQSSSLGNEQREYFGSGSAHVKGSKNWAGIENKVIDALIEDLVNIKDYQEMLDCAHAIDRVLCWNYYMITGWSFDGLTVAYWNTFGIPKNPPECCAKSSPFPMLGWWCQPQPMVKIATQKAGMLAKIKQIIKSWFS